MRGGFQSRVSPWNIWLHFSRRHDTRKYIRNSYNTSDRATHTIPVKIKGKDNVDVMEEEGLHRYLVDPVA